MARALLGLFYWRTAMTVRIVIDEFATRTKLQVRVRDVRDFLVSGRLAVKSRIMFYGAELDIGVARALLHEYTEPATGILLVD